MMFVIVFVISPFRALQVCYATRVVSRAINVAYISQRQNTHLCGSLSCSQINGGSDRWCCSSSGSGSLRSSLSKSAMLRELCSKAINVTYIPQRQNNYLCVSLSWSEINGGWDCWWCSSSGSGSLSECAVLWKLHWAPLAYQKQLNKGL